MRTFWKLILKIKGSKTLSLCFSIQAARDLECFQIIWEISPIKIFWNSPKWVFRNSVIVSMQAWTNNKNKEFKSFMTFNCNCCNMLLHSSPKEYLTRPVQFTRDKIKMWWNNFWNPIKTTFWKKTKLFPKISESIRFVKDLVSIKTASEWILEKDRPMDFSYRSLSEKLRNNCEMIKLSNLAFHDKVIDSFYFLIFIFIYFKKMLLPQIYIFLLGFFYLGSAI